MVTLDGLQLDDNTVFLLEEINYRSVPDRDVIIANISRRPGDKILGTEWRTKDIELIGRVFSTTASGLQGYVDILQNHFAIQSANLIIDAGRTYTVTLKKLNIPTQFYNNTMAKFSAVFLAADPFAYAPSQTVSGTVSSGVQTIGLTLNVSGTVFAEPVINLIPRTLNAGDSAINTFMIVYSGTGENVTISGTQQYNSQTQLDYHALTASISGVANSFAGVFARWQPGLQNFSITSSGSKQSYDWKLQYQPRFYE